MKGENSYNSNTSLKTGLRFFFMTDVYCLVEFGNINLGLSSTSTYLKTKIHTGTNTQYIGRVFIKVKFTGSLKPFWSMGTRFLHLTT